MRTIYGIYISKPQQWWYAASVIYMMTSSNGNIFRVTDHLCGEFTGHRWIPCTKASDAEAELWCFLWSAPENKRSSKQSRSWWFETQSRPLWRHCHVQYVDDKNTNNIRQFKLYCQAFYKAMEITPLKNLLKYGNLSYNIYRNLGNRFSHSVAHIPPFGIRDPKKNCYFCTLLQLILIFDSKKNWPHFPI